VHHWGRSATSPPASDAQRPPDLERADRIGEFWGYPESRTFAELLIDCEEDRKSGRCSSGCYGSPTGARGPQNAPSRRDNAPDCQINVE
jgi:hypothetical protein